MHTDVGLVAFDNRALCHTVGLATEISCQGTTVDADKPYIYTLPDGTLKNNHNADALAQVQL